MDNEKVIYATGRRKTSSARVFLKPGTGKFTVNAKDMTVYLSRKASRLTVIVPLELTKTLGKFDIEATVKGGGETGQAGAIRLGIARALCADDISHRGTLKKAGLLTRDSREVERKKYGQHGARKNTQYSKR